MRCGRPAPCVEGVAPGLATRGRLVFIEHVRSADPKLARKQDRMNGINRVMVGCECNRPTLLTIEAEGFDVTKIEHTTVKKIPKWVSPFIVGSATATSRLGLREVPLGGREQYEVASHQGELSDVESLP